MSQATIVSMYEEANTRYQQMKERGEDIGYLAGLRAGLYAAMSPTSRVAVQLLLDGRERGNTNCDRCATPTPATTMVAAYDGVMHHQCEDCASWTYRERQEEKSSVHSLWAPVR